MADSIFLVGYLEELYNEIKMVLDENEHRVVKVPVSSLETFTKIHRPKTIIFMTDGKSKVLYEISKTMRKQYPQIKIVFIADRADQKLVINVFRSGGSALVLKNFVRTKLLNILEEKRGLNSSLCF